MLCRWMIRFLTFQRMMVLPYSRSKQFVHWLNCCIKAESIMISQNAGNLSPNKAASCPWRPVSSADTLHVIYFMVLYLHLVQVQVLSSALHFQTGTNSKHSQNWKKVWSNDGTIKLCSADCASLHNLANKANLVHNLFFVYLFITLYVFRATYVPIIRRNNCIYAKSGICHSVRMTVWHAGWNSTLHARPSSTQSDKYQASHIHSHFSWRRARSHPKHVDIL